MLNAAAQQATRLAREQLAAAVRGVTPWLDWTNR
jgi:2-keto-4-pentenoate hydratase/2-oxohepta-3-ene-1,7-dioic acid hydratase in catechol pathway